LRDDFGGGLVAFLVVKEGFDAAAALHFAFEGDGGDAVARGEAL
jgi:hypothetical protein